MNFACDKQAMHFELGRTDIYDDREAGFNYTVGNFAVDRFVVLLH